MRRSPESFGILGKRGSGGEVEERVILLESSMIFRKCELFREPWPGPPPFCSEDAMSLLKFMYLSPCCLAGTDKENNGYHRLWGASGAQRGFSGQGRSSSWDLLSAIDVLYSHAGSLLAGVLG